MKTFFIAVLRFPNRVGAALAVDPVTTRSSTLIVRILTALVLVAVVGLLVAAFLLEEPMPSWFEREINEPLDGYSGVLGGIDVHPMTASVTLDLLGHDRSHRAASARGVG